MDTAAFPSVAVVFDASSVSPMTLAAASAGRWTTVWVLDSPDVESRAATRMLARLGPVVDVTGVDPVDAAAAIGQYSPDGILAFADHQLGRTAAIAAALGLPYYSPAVTERLTNKVVQRRVLAAAGIEDLGFWPISAHASAAQRAAAVSQARFPAIVKPQAGNGSRHVCAVEDAAALADYVDGVLEGPDATDLIIEELLTDGVARSEQIYGDYLSVESLVVRGRIHHLGVTGRFPLEEPFRESGFFTPGDIDHELQQQVLDLVGRAVHVLEVDHGVLHSEVKLTPTGPRILEINGRLGGGMSDILELASGVSLLDLAIQASLGRPPGLSGLARCDRVAFLLYLQAPATATGLEALDGLAAAQAIPGVESVAMNRRPGDALDWRDGNHGYYCSVLGAAPDHRAMLVLREQILATVNATFSYEPSYSGRS